MREINGIIDLFKSLNNKQAPNNNQGYILANRDEPPSRNSKDWMEMYNKNPRLSPVTKMSLDIATTKGRIIRTKSDGQEQVEENHPLLDLLYKPNKEYNITGVASLYLSQVHYLIKGESFGIIERASNGDPQFLWFVPPHMVTLPGDVNPDHYKVQLNKRAEALYVHKKDMFYRKNPNPMDPMGRGIGRVEALADEVETDEYMAKFAKRFFFNDATPNIVITAPEESNDEDIKRAERKWYQKFGGFLNSSKAAFLNWEAKLHVLNTSNREMDFIESRKFYRDLAIQHFGIPPEIMGNVENSNKATVVAARDIYRNEVLEAMYIEFEQAITWQLLGEYSERQSKNRRFEFVRHKETEEQLQKDFVVKAFDQGSITIGEYRNVIQEILDIKLDKLENDYEDHLSLPANRVLIDTKSPYVDQMDNISSIEGRRQAEENNNGDNNDEGGEEQDGD